MNIPEEVSLQLLRQLDANPHLNQRGLADRMGLSLGKVNYCVRALVRKGLVKIRNFRRSDNKLAYAYLLTPSGIEAKARLTVKFLRRKQAEYGQLQLEIERLQAEVVALERGKPEARSNDDA